MLLVQVLRALKIINYPVPPFVNRIRTGGKSFNNYYQSGITTYMPILTVALQAGMEFTESTKILDFGCGVARQLLHFTRNYPDACYYACDVNESNINFIKQAYPQVQSYQNKFIPPLPYDSGFFDFIYSVSVFSHLSMSSQQLWLAELSRVTKKNGYCLLTTEGKKALSFIKRARLVGWTSEHDSLLAQYGYAYIEYADFSREKLNESVLSVGSKYVGIGESFGCMVMTPAYIRDTWTQYGFEVVSVLPGVINHRQDLVVLKKL